MKRAYISILIGLNLLFGTVILIGAQVNSTEPNNIAVTPTPTQTKTPQKTNCLMPVSKAEMGTTPTPTPSPENLAGHPSERSSAEIIAGMKKYDRDCDGINDYDDNCTEVYNPNQADKNKDGFGDACERKKQRKSTRRKQ